MKNVKEQTPIRQQGMVLENEVITWSNLLSVFDPPDRRQEPKCPIVTP